jgi:hypothetical protein
LASFKVKIVAAFEVITEGESLSVLPGIEFRTDLGGKEAVHLIGIFPENCNLEDMWTKISCKLELTPGGGGDGGILIPPFLLSACDPYTSAIIRCV